MIGSCAVIPFSAFPGAVRPEAPPLPRVGSMSLASGQAELHPALTCER